MEELGAELHAAQAKFTVSTSQFNGVRRRLEILLVERHSTVALVATAIGDLQASEVARDGPSRQVTAARRRALWMESALTNSHKDVDDSLDASNLCCSTTWSAVNSRPRT